MLFLLLKIICYFCFEGAAGVTSAFAYAGLTSIGVSPRQSLLIMLIVPVLMAFGYDTSFFFIRNYCIWCQTYLDLYGDRLGTYAFLFSFSIVAQKFLGCIILQFHTWLANFLPCIYIMKSMRCYYYVCI